MAKWFHLLQYLNEEQIDWIFEISQEVNLKEGHRLIEKNTQLDAIYFVIQGLLRVHVFPNIQKPTMLLGPGEIIGEISFLDGGKTTATLITDENTLLLKLPTKILLSKLTTDSTFANHFYKSLANTIASRYRQTINELEFIKEAKQISTKFHQQATLGDLFKTLESFKQTMNDINKESIQGSRPSESIIQQAQAQFTKLADMLDTLLSDRSSLDDDTKKKIGRQAQNEILPFILLTELASRIYNKPRGYASDHQIIDLIYRNKGGGIGVVGPLVDSFFLNRAAVHAIRNRPGILSDEIIKLTKSKKDIVKIASLANGPAKEIFDAYEALSDKSKLKATLIDFDTHSLALVADKRDQLGLGNQIELLNENLIYLALGKKKIQLSQFDLIYSIGLIDYLEDALVVKLINYIYDYLIDGGKIIISNFHPNNPDRMLMEHILEWHLIYRTEDDINNLFKTSKFKKPCTRIRFDKERINLFAECVK